AASFSCSVIDRSNYPLPDGWQAEPIPLTEEVLRKAGFEFINEAGGFANEKHIIYWNGEWWSVHPFCTNDNDCVININSLHQLQNLYFALTGQELEVKW